MRFLLLAIAFSVALLPASSQDKKPDDAKKPEAKKPPRIAINDPAKLKDNKDFAIQGEYSCVTKDNQKLGMQAVARGDGHFDLWSYVGGLPEEKWDGMKADKNLKALTIDGKTIIYAAVKDSSGRDQEIGSIAGGAITIEGENSQTIIAKKVDRKSPTLDAKPPEGAIVLFNGPDDLAKWDAKAKIVELSDGKFLGVGGRTKQKFQSFVLHVEFRLPFMPNSTGQARGNSGVYIQDRYEVQVLDSFGLPLHDNECGGIYKESAPKVNMCFPPMTWQTYDIDFTAATFVDGKKTKPSVITVKHNGVVIHDKLELKNNTPGGGINKEIPEPGALYLQDHGDPVVYRNIWIVEKK